MSEIDLNNHDMSTDAAGDEKLVPVAEAIRYRKRAQSAEKEAAGLTEEVSRLREANAQLATQADALRTDGALTAALVSAGVVDLEAAMLMARSRMEKDDGARDPAAVVATLQKEKQYLFRQGGATTPVPSRTAGIKDIRPAGQKVLEEAARQAAASGSRAHVHEYMRRRRKRV